MYKLNIKKGILIALVFLNSSILAAYGGNPIGIPGFQEFFVFILVVYSTLFIFMNKKVHKFDFYVFLLAILPFIYSAFMAWITYGQPIIYGFFELRKSLGLFIYFPIILSYRLNLVNTDDLLNWVQNIAIICALFSILYGFIGGQKISNSDVLLSQSDIGRSGVGKHYIACGLLIFLSKFKKNKSTYCIFGFLLLYATLLLFVQTRQIIISVTICSLFLFYKRNLLVAIALSLFPIIILYLTVESNDLKAFIDIYLPRFSKIFDAGMLEESVRARTIHYVLDNFNWFGHGGLSNFWNNGFKRIYYKNFILADIGLLGSFFRFGVFSVLIAGSYVLKQLMLFYKARNENNFDVIFSIWLFLMIIWPTSPILENLSHIVGLVLALSYGSYQCNKKKISI